MKSEKDRIKGKTERSFQQIVIDKFGRLLGEESKLVNEYPFLSFVTRPVKATIIILVYIIILLTLTVLVTLTLKRLGVGEDLSIIIALILSILIFFITLLFLIIGKIFKKDKERRHWDGTNSRKK